MKRKTPLEWKKYYESHMDEPAYHYDGPLGVELTEDGHTVFRLWSPVARWVKVLLYRTDTAEEVFRVCPMAWTEAGVWESRLSGRLTDVYYQFEVNVDGETFVTGDPQAKACGANGKRSMVVDLAATNPEGWEADKAPARGPEDIIYELHVKEFSWDSAGGFPEAYRGKYMAFTCPNTSLNGEGRVPTGVAYLKWLGVTHVQLMPVFDYGSVNETGRQEAFNWGYDPVNYNVPEGSYATDPHDGNVRIRELKSAVMALHKAGFRVIMDVVYNHSFSLDGPLQCTVPWYFYRVTETGGISNGSACGNDTASERYMCGRFILESVLYWAEEYHMDGFRFDLMGLHDVGLMNRIRQALNERFGPGEKLIYGEPWRAGDTAFENEAISADKYHLADLAPGIGIFCDDTRDALKGSVFDAADTGYVNGKPGMEKKIASGVRAWSGSGRSGSYADSPDRIITYVTAHDNHTLWDKLKVTTRERALRVRQNRLAASICLTSQGRPFMLSGEEFLRTKDGIENAYRSPISINRLDWQRSHAERAMADYYRGLIALRKRLPAFCDKTSAAPDRIRMLETEKGIVCFLADNRPGSTWEELLVVYNANDRPVTDTIPEGQWQVLSDGEDSWLWKREGGDRRLERGNLTVAPVSAVILGRVDEM